MLVHMCWQAIQVHLFVKFMSVLLLWQNLCVDSPVDSPGDHSIVHVLFLILSLSLCNQLIDTGEQLC